MRIRPHLPPRGRDSRQRRLHVPGRWLRTITIAGLLSGLLGLLTLVMPLVAHGDTLNLASYGATASGWAIQPYVVNDEFINIPATDQSAPYVFVSIDNTPSADAKAAYFFPGTAINAVLTTENTGKQVPNGVDARYPGNGSASNQVGPVSDNVANQAGGASESAQAGEGSAQAAAGLVSYQFAPNPGAPSPPGGGTVPAPPALPTPPVIGGGGLPGGGGNGGSAPTPTPTPAPHPMPTPTATPCTLGICLSSPIGAGGQTSRYRMVVVGSSPTSVKLPDPVEQQLATALHAVEAANLPLLQLAHGHFATPNSSLPYAAADASSRAVTQATNSGVSVTVTTHAAHVELFQGLITFASVDSTLQGQAPASNAQGQVSITTTITGAQIGGIPITIDQNGVQVNGQGGAQSSSAEQTLTAALNSALKAANIQITLTSTTTTKDAGKWQGSGGGLEVAAAIVPGNGVPATHVDFTLGKVTGSAFAVPGSTNSGSCDFLCFGSGGGNGGGILGGFFGSATGSNTSGSNTPGSQGGGSSHGGGLFSLPEELSPGELLSLLFVVQGFSTAAVSAAASNAETLAKASMPVLEEESR